MSDDTAGPAETQPRDRMVPCAKCRGLSLRSRVLEQPRPTCICCGFTINPNEEPTRSASP